MLDKQIRKGQPGLHCPFLSLTQFRLSQPFPGYHFLFTTGVTAFHTARIVHLHATGIMLHGAGVSSTRIFHFTVLHGAGVSSARIFHCTVLHGTGVFPPARIFHCTGIAGIALHGAGICRRQFGHAERLGVRHDGNTERNTDEQGQDNGDRLLVHDFSSSSLDGILDCYFIRLINPASDYFAVGAAFTLRVQVSRDKWLT